MPELDDGRASCLPPSQSLVPLALRVLSTPVQSGPSNADKYANEPKEHADVATVDLGSDTNDVAPAFDDLKLDCFRPKSVDRNSDRMHTGIDLHLAGQADCLTQNLTVNTYLVLFLRRRPALTQAKIWWGSVNYRDGAWQDSPFSWQVLDAARRSIRAPSAERLHADVR